MKTINEILETAQAERLVDEAMDLVAGFKDQPDEFSVSALLLAAGILAHKNRIPLDQFQAVVATSFESAGNVMQRAEAAHREAQRRAVFDQ